MNYHSVTIPRLCFHSLAVWILDPQAGMLWFEFMVLDASKMHGIAFPSLDSCGCVLKMNIIKKHVSRQKVEFKQTPETQQKDFPQKGHLFRKLFSIRKMWQNWTQSVTHHQN